MTKYTQEGLPSKEVEKSMADEPIYPGGGQPKEYQTSSGMDDINFNKEVIHRRRKAGK